MAHSHKYKVNYPGHNSSLIYDVIVENIIASLQPVEFKYKQQEIYGKYMDVQSVGFGENLYEL